MADPSEPALPPPPPDDRSNLEKLDDLQAGAPFGYNLAVGVVIGALAWLLLRIHPVLVVAYALAYAALRWFLWQEGRVLRRQYEARAVRWREQQEQRRRKRLGG